jgi:putative transcriptional regulator
MGMVNISNKLIMKGLEGMRCRIKEIRESRGIKQTFIAEQVGISQQLLSNYEKNKALPRIDRAIRISEVLGMDVKEVWVEDGE